MTVSKTSPAEVGAKFEPLVLTIEEAANKLAREHGLNTGLGRTGDGKLAIQVIGDRFADPTYEGYPVVSRAGFQPARGGLTAEDIAAEQAKTGDRAALTRLAIFFGAHLARKGVAGATVVPGTMDSKPTLQVTLSRPADTSQIASPYEGITVAITGP